jgi:hypothetical protein
VRAPLAAAVLALGLACASVGEQVKDACPESRHLVCRKGDVVCSPDPARACRVCACRGYTEPDPAGTLRPPMDALYPPAPADAKKP